MLHSTRIILVELHLFLFLVDFFRLNYSCLWLYVVIFLCSNSFDQVRSGSDVSCPFHFATGLKIILCLSRWLLIIFPYLFVFLQRIYIQDVISKGKVHPTCDVSGTSGA